MTEHRTVGVVGLGRMGQTLAAAFGRAVGPGRLFAAGRSAASIARLRENVPDAVVVTLDDLPDAATLIVLCVPNAELPTVLDGLRPRLTAANTTVAINNRQRLRALAEEVPGPVAKMIPCAGNELGAGATLLMPGPRMTERETESVLGLLRTFSTPFVIDEDQGRAATDLASCGPALLATAAAAMADAQVERGAPVSRELAEQLVARSLEVAGLLVGGGTSLAELIDRVAVPGGNTAAAIAASRDELVAAWRSAFDATARNEGSSRH